MSATIISPERMTRLTGFGMLSAGDGYLFRPISVEDVQDVIRAASDAGFKITQRGSGRSYGDANVGHETVILDMTRMKRILHWDRHTGVLECEAGATIETLWRFAIEEGYWPPVVSGTMYPTLGGALAMNIHGKNNFCQGTLGEHVLEIEVVDAQGAVFNLTPKDELFYAVISGAGLMGVVTKVKLQMKKIHSGDLKVFARSIPNLEAQFEAFEQFEHEADYMVSWIDCFPGGKQTGRGLFHAAWYADGPISTLRPEHQDLPDTVLGLLPKSVVWRALKIFSTRFGMRSINTAKFYASKYLGNEATHTQSLVAFSFLLDYVPNWRWAYKPCGFIQYQSFVPKEHAPLVFQKQLELQQAAEIESYLGVMKRHRPDKFLLSHAVDGYSLALDFKVTEDTKQKVWDLAHRMNDIVLDAGGRFYLAKDSTLRPSDVKRYLGENALRKFAKFRDEMDPNKIFTSSLAERTGLADPQSLLANS
ncbi:MAG: FAD-binding oxidoreductase [Armatimonadetes bacterium]|nr:FAD-binding oxidoreductase [Armatimonadota bacterium]